MASKVLWLVALNLPLGHHHKYSEADVEDRPAWWDSKKLENVAGKIVNGLSQYSVAELVAKEWDEFPPQLRMVITNTCNTGWRSGNVTKGVAYLDKLLGGKVRRHEVSMPTERVVRIGADGRLFATRRALRPAVLGASRAFAIVALPANYKNMSPQEKRREQKKLADIRRQSRSDR